jgi:preprotein translocase subunit SecD
MKNKNRLVFALILILVLGAVYLSIYGLEMDQYKISPYRDEIKLGLDLSGGVYVVLEAVTDATGQELDEKMAQTRAIIAQRVDGLGVSEPNITIENRDRIRVELAGLSNPQEAIDLIGKTAMLQFIEPDGTVILTGQNVRDSVVTYNERNEIGVSLEFDNIGATAFSEATGRLLNEPMEQDRIIRIVLDDEVISSPFVSAHIRDGRSFISGGFTIDSASNLANLIKAGALPVEMREVEISAIGPSLGLESLDRSIFAAMIGLILIFAFMLIFYRLPGLVANVALTLYILIVLGIVIGLNANLTLPGIAGLILSVGMAVDANVVIFERIKEEMQVGKTIRTSVDSGFKRAMSTIVDANVTTLIAGVVLFYFGTGPIRGFAVTLLIGLLTSLFTALVITRLLLKLVVKMDLTRSKKMYGVKEVAR